MALENINEFIKNTTSTTHENNWNFEALKKICGHRLPDGIFNENQTLIQADATTLWLRWFIESLCSPMNYVEEPAKNETHIFQDALIIINKNFPGSPRPHREALAELIAKKVYRDVKIERGTSRTFATKEQKIKLITSGEARCWICGYKFTEPAIDSFLGKKTSNPLTQPHLIDIFRPRGINKSDLRIEVEHINPVSLGGQGDENLALSCGWCNRYKSSRTSIYDVTSRTYRVKFKIGEQTRYELPNPFWVVRITATHQSCQYHEGCDKTAKNSELYISLPNKAGSPNPTNLQVLCSEHDPLIFERFVSIDTAKEIWTKKRKKISFDFNKELITP